MIIIMAIGIVSALAITGHWKIARDFSIIFLLLFLLRLWVHSYVR